MTTMSEAREEEPLDGRRARRDRNRAAVLDSVIEMFREEWLIPSIEDAAKRSGLSLRSVYRYFEDPDALIEAAIERSIQQGAAHAAIHAIGQGPFDDRLEEFVRVRVRLFEHAQANFRATLHNAPRNARIRDALEDTRRRLRQQLEQQFRPELAALPKQAAARAAAAADALTQFDAIDLLRRHRRFTVAETEAVLTQALRALLGG